MQTILTLFCHTPEHLSVCFLLIIICGYQVGYTRSIFDWAEVCAWEAHQVQRQSYYACVIGLRNEGVTYYPTDMGDPDLCGLPDLDYCIMLLISNHVLQVLKAEQTSSKCR